MMDWVVATCTVIGAVCFILVLVMYILPFLYKDKDND